MKDKQPGFHITIMGIGNTLYQDEGIGIHALPLLQESLKHVAEIDFVDGTTDGMRLLGPVEDTDYLIVIDAVNAGKPGGTIITLYDEEIPAYMGLKMSIHQLGFQEVLYAAKLRDRYPKHLALIGMQPSHLELGVGLSEANQQMLPCLINRVVEQVKEWRASS